jgi:hypothetical protein
MDNMPRFPRYGVYCDAVKVGDFIDNLLFSMGPSQNVQLLIGKHVYFRLLDQAALKC